MADFDTIIVGAGSAGCALASGRGAGPYHGAAGRLRITPSNDSKGLDRIFLAAADVVALSAPLPRRPATCSTPGASPR